MLDRAGRGDVHRAAVHMASQAARGPKEFFLDRIVSHAQYGTAIFSERDCHDEFGHSLDELFGAVERVDNPYALALQAIAIVGGLLREPSVMRELPAKTRLERIVGLEIGGGDGIVVALGIDFILVVSPMAAQDLACGKRSLTRGSQFIFQTGHLPSRARRVSVPKPLPMSSWPPFRFVLPTLAHFAFFSVCRTFSY